MTSKDVTLLHSLYSLHE